MIGAILLSEGVQRDGELTDRSLRDALATEQSVAGARDSVLVVSTEELRERALRILGPGGGIDALRSVLPNVELDASLPVGTWQLRPV